MLGRDADGKTSTIVIVTARVLMRGKNMKRPATCQSGQSIDPAVTLSCALDTPYDVMLRSMPDQGIDDGRVCW